MILDPIFDIPDFPGEGLWAVRYNGDQENIFDKCFELWRDVEEMLAWCETNINDLQMSYGNTITPVEAAYDLMDEADDLEEYVLMNSLKPNTIKNLQAIFRPLDNSDTSITVLQKSKTSAKTRWRPMPKLRLYAVRIDVNAYVITGGAIKLTNTMNERSHTKQELQKLNLVRDWLKSEGIQFPGDLKELYDTQG